MDRQLQFGGTVLAVGFAHGLKGCPSWALTQSWWAKECFLEEVTPMGRYGSKRPGVPSCIWVHVPREPPGSELKGRDCKSWPALLGTFLPGVQTVPLS